MWQGERWRDEWKGKVSRNSLVEVHKYFYGGKGADKAMQKVRGMDRRVADTILWYRVGRLEMRKRERETADAFQLSPGSYKLKWLISVLRKRADVENHRRVPSEFQFFDVSSQLAIQNLTTYCADDVLLTLQIYQKLAPLFREQWASIAQVLISVDFENGIMDIPPFLMKIDPISAFPTPQRWLVCWPCPRPIFPLISELNLMKILIDAESSRINGFVLNVSIEVLSKWRNKLQILANVLREVGSGSGGADQVRMG